jgi:hypothetical protein
MKKQLLALCLLIASLTNAQNKLFSTYTDAKILAQDANAIVTDFIKEATGANKNIDISATAILNTSPYLVYWDDSLKTVNLPLWTEVIAPQQQFFIALNDSNEKKGIEMFGLFFNGFYIAHELGHGIEWQQMKIGNKFCKGLYESEYFANTLAIIYWKQKGKEKELAACYAYAKKFVAQLPNPVPANEDPIVFFNTHYDELSVDPFKYGYYQFKQFVEIYEQQQLPSFSNYLAQKIPTEKSK